MSSFFEIVFAILFLGAACRRVTGDTSGCTDDWDTTKYNTYTPSPSNDRNDSEPMPNKTVLEAFCPPGTGKLTVRCADTDNSEEFTDVNNDTNSMKTCNTVDGMHCMPNEFNGTCPDLYLQIGCCRNPNTTPVPSNGQQATTEKGKGSTNQNGDNGNPIHVTTHGSAASAGQNNAQNDDNGSIVSYASIGILLVGFLSSIWLSV